MDGNEIKQLIQIIGKLAMILRRFSKWWGKYEQTPVTDKNRDYSVKGNFNSMRVFWCGKTWGNCFNR